MKFFVLLVSFFAYSSASLANVSITTRTIPNGTVDASYSATLAASGGCLPYSWTISGALPPGLHTSVAGRGTSLTLSGTPTTSGTYAFSATVMGCGKHTSRVSYTVLIQPAPVHIVNLSWTASSSPNLAGYNLYRAPDCVNWQLINSGLIASTLYTDSTVSNGSTYYYAATALNITGQESSKSTPIVVAIP